MSAFVSTLESLRAPRLSAEEIRRELERVLATERRSTLVALFGAGDAAEVQLEDGPYRVVPTTCELELRAAMPAGARDGDRLVFLVDWAETLPLDLRCRVAGGKLYRPAADRRLAVLFGARLVEAGLAQTALARLILAGEIPAPGGAVSGQMLRREDLFRRYLQAHLEVPHDGVLSGPRLVVWALSKGGGSALAARDGDDWEALRREVVDFLAEPAGALGRAAWSAWLEGHGRRLVELLLLLESLAPSLGTGTYAEGLLKGKLPQLAPGFGPALLAALTGEGGRRLADAALREVKKAEPELFRGLLKSAAALVDDPAMAAALAGSRWLGVGLEARRRELAAAVAEAVAHPGTETLEAAAKALEALEQHEGVVDEARDRREGRRMLLRLCTWRAARAARPVVAAGAPYQRAVELASRYRLEGGWVDHARLRLRQLDEPGLGEAVKAVLAVVDELRARDDRDFAQGLCLWLAGGRPATQVVSAAQAGRRLVAEFLAGREGRRLLVVLLDGMSWANAVELLPSLADESGRWKPAQWQPKGFRQASEPLLPPMLAALPTITAVSRAAIFAGKEASGHGAEPTAKDRERWAAQAAIRKLFGDDGEPRLLLKDEVIHDGGLHDVARKAIRGDAPVVALVLNAIDEQLSGSAQLRTTSTASRIAPLPAVLTEAEAADRAVLLLSDHGHVPGLRMHSVGATGSGGRRWRPLKAGESAADFEIEMPEGGGWRPPGARTVALVVDENVCYGQPNAGEHGGASLAEVVAPAILVVPEHLAAQSGDKDLEQVDFPKPSWWESFRAPSAVKVGEPAAAAAPRPVQTSFLEPTPPPPPPPKPAAITPSAPPPLLQALEASPVFKAHTDGMSKDKLASVRGWLTVLLEAGGQLEQGEFSRRVGILDRRAGGAAARMMEVLNLEGYQVVEFDPAGKQVRVDIELLKQLFELESA